jgi:hypothetical protein
MWTFIEPDVEASPVRGVPPMARLLLLGLMLHDTKHGPQ